MGKTGKVTGVHLHFEYRAAPLGGQQRLSNDLSQLEQVIVATNEFQQVQTDINSLEIFRKKDNEFEQEIGQVYSGIVLDKNNQGKNCGHH